MFTPKTPKNRYTTYGRANASKRKRIRKIALTVPCCDCGALAGKHCVGTAGKPAQPHWIRRKLSKAE